MFQENWIVTPSIVIECNILTNCRKCECTHKDNEILACFRNMILEDRTKNEKVVRNITITAPV